MASTPGSGATPEPLQKRRARSPRVLRCARYRVPARPRARAPRSAGPRGATRRPRRLGRRPRRPGAPARANRAANASPAAAGEHFAPAARARGSRPRARGRAARPAPRVQRPRRRAPRRRGPARGPAAGRRPGAGAAPRRAAADLCAGLAAGGDHFPGLGRRAASKGRRATLQTALLRCAAGSSVSPTARHAARRIIEGYWTLSGALFFVSCNWFCESVTVGARRDFFFARTAQPFGRVRTPGTDQTTRKRVSRRSTSNKRGTPDRRAVNIAESCCMWTTYRNTMHHAWRHRMCFGKVLERLRWKSKLSGRIRSPTTC